MSTQATASTESSERSIMPSQANAVNTDDSQRSTMLSQETGPERALKWSRAMEAALFDTLVEEVRKGKRAESGFKKTAWTEVILKVTEQMVVRRSLSQKQCQSKMDGYKKLWKEWWYLRNLSGWGWDTVTELFIADDEQWRIQISVRMTQDPSYYFIILIMIHPCQQHPLCKPLRYSPLLYRIQMDELFVGTTATGVGASTIQSRILGASDVVSDLGSDDESRHSEDVNNSSPEPVVLPKTRKRKRKRSSVSPKVGIISTIY